MRQTALWQIAQNKPGQRSGGPRAAARCGRRHGLHAVRTDHGRSSTLGRKRSGQTPTLPLPPLLLGLPSSPRRLAWCSRCNAVRCTPSAQPRALTRRPPPARGRTRNRRRSKRAQRGQADAVAARRQRGQVTRTQLCSQQQTSSHRQRGQGAAGSEQC